MVINMKSLRSKLNRGIDRFRKLQATYAPAAIQALAKRVAPADELAEDVPLMLPSALTPAEREGGGCVKGLLEVEDSLRAAQCRAALPRLRNQLHIKSRFLLYKRLHSRHQGMNTRSRTLIARNESKIRLHSEKFQMAWQARLRVANGDKSKVGWPQLKKEDIRCMQDAEERSRNAEKRRKASDRLRRKEDELREDGLLPALEEDEDDEMVTRGGENFREISWIWTVAGTAGTDEELEDGTHQSISEKQQFIQIYCVQRCVSNGPRRGHEAAVGRRKFGFSKRNGDAFLSRTHTANSCGCSALLLSQREVSPRP
jgi:hypothetical protein